MAIRILHVVGVMNRGGAETWLMHVLRHIDRERFRMDFLVHSTQPGTYDHEIHTLGSSVIPCLHPSRPWAYARNFKKALREHGPYDVIHSHVHHYSGYLLRSAHRNGVPVRIAHSHVDSSASQQNARFIRRFYLALMKRWISRYATSGIAASREAAASLFSPTWEADSRWRVLHYAIDLAPFQAVVDREAVRSRLHIPPGAFVIGHVGRFHEQKNHLFLVDIAADVAKLEPKMCLLLVGEGRQRAAIEKSVARTGLGHRVVFTGARADVPYLMLGAMDVFLLPSHYEGLPLVGLEAQAAGLPLILSDAITPEIGVVPILVRRLSLAQPASFWAQTALKLRHIKSDIVQREALATMEKSPFNIASNVGALEDVYGASRRK